MTNLYDPRTGELDLDRARLNLAATSARTDDANARRLVTEIGTAVLIDIAASLRTVAAEASLGLLATHSFDVALTNPDTGEIIDDDEQPVAEGDDVRVIGTGRVGSITSFGEDQGELYATVAFPIHGDDAIDYSLERFYLRNLERVDLVTEPSDAVDDPDAEAEVPYGDDGDGDPVLDDFEDAPAPKPRKKGSKK